MENILVSSCLLGLNTKYNGGNNYKPLIEEIKKHYNVIPICPEVSGGLAIPRDSSEIKGNLVVSIKGIDVSKEYIKGAELALDKALKYNCKIAILKDKSPSCGRVSYDGTFTKKLIDRHGITYNLLVNNGIKIYTENEISELLNELGES